MEETCSVCERVTKYKCIKCKVYVCALCAPETAQTVNKVEYRPMKQVGVCLTCQQLQRPEIDNEDDDTTPESHSFPASQNTEPSQNSEASQNLDASQNSDAGQNSDTSQNSEDKQNSEASQNSEATQKTGQAEQPKQQFHKRKQWTREQKLEFIDLYKYKNKAKAAREFTERYKVHLKSSTYNPWIAQELKLRNDPRKSRKPGAGRQASYLEMEKQLYSEFKDLRSKGIKVKEWWFRN